MHVDLTDENWTCLVLWPFSLGSQLLMGESASLQGVLQTPFSIGMEGCLGSMRSWNTDSNPWGFSGPTKGGKAEITDPGVRRQLAALLQFRVPSMVQGRKIQGRQEEECDHLCSRNSLQTVGITVETGAPPSSPSSATDESVTVVSHGPPSASVIASKTSPQFPCLWMFGQSLLGHFRLSLARAGVLSHENSGRKTDPQ